MMKPKLRIGLLLDDYLIPSWMLWMTQRIFQSHYAEIVLILISEQDEKRGSVAKRKGDNWSSALYRLYSMVDTAISKCTPDALEMVEFPINLKGIQTIIIKDHITGSLKWVDNQDLRRIEDLRIDVFIDMGLQKIHNEIARTARYGVWSTSMGDDELYKGRPAGFWEIFDSNPITSSNVRIMLDDLDAKVIYRSYSHTVKKSVKMNENQTLCKCFSFIPRKLEELYNYGEKALNEVSQNPHNARENNTPRFVPTNLEVLSFLLRRFKRGYSDASRRLLRNEQWMVRYRLGENPFINDANLITLTPPARTWWADPHVTFMDGNYYLFIEELKLPRSSNRGHISVIRIDEQGNHYAPIQVLERPYHLSYPCIFHTEGTYYMIPETVNNHSIELYRAIDFPLKWQFEKYIMKDIVAVDSTIWYKEGLWWLFTNIKENYGASINDELFLFYSTDLFGDDWIPHPKNPIVSDARIARSGGGLFEWKGDLYRPSQDCSKCYGYQININKIVQLNESEYREELTSVVGPKGYANTSRIHTFDYCKGIVIFDAFMNRSRLRLGP
jgi:hypothetical protein